MMSLVMMIMVVSLVCGMRKKKKVQKKQLQVVKQQQELLEMVLRTNGMPVPSLGTSMVAKKRSFISSIGWIIVFSIVALVVFKFTWPFLYALKTLGLKGFIDCFF